MFLKKILLKSKVHKFSSVRVGFCVLVAIAGFIFVAYGNVLWVALFGIALTSLGCGLGEVTFLGYSSSYHKNVVSIFR